MFGYVNILVADLKNVNWNFTGLAPQFNTLRADALKVKTPLHALTLYFTTTCKLTV